MKALFVGAHTDEEICFAGSMQHYNNKFYVAFSTCGHPDLKKEFDASCDLLDVCSVASTLTVRSFDRQAIADFLYDQQKGFDCIFTHSVNSGRGINESLEEKYIHLLGTMER
jgi:hypothetical protein